MYLLTAQPAGSNDRAPMNGYELLSPPRNVSDHEYRSVRQAFLRSYTFQRRESYRERAVRGFRELDLRKSINVLDLKKSLRELNEMRKTLASQISRRVFDGRLGRARAFRSFRLRLPRFEIQFDPLRCFALRKDVYSEEAPTI